MDIREGDEVTVKATAMEVHDLRVRVVFGHNDAWNWIERSDIATVSPRPIKAGDRVDVRGWLKTYDVIHVDGVKAWLRSGDDDVFVRLTDLTRA